MGATYLFVASSASVNAPLFCEGRHSFVNVQTNLLRFRSGSFLIGRSSPSSCIPLTCLPRSFRQFIFNRSSHSPCPPHSAYYFWCLVILVSSCNHFIFLLSYRSILRYCTIMYTITYSNVRYSTVIYCTLVYILLYSNVLNYNVL